MSMEKTYSSSEIQRIAKITKMQAIHWTQTGVITPLQDAHGRGSKRVYSWVNLIEMMICRELNRYNVERSFMKVIIGDINRPYHGFKTYWDYLKQNPKTDKLYLVISIIDGISVALGALEKRGILEIEEEIDLEIEEEIDLEIEGEMEIEHKVLKKLIKDLQKLDEHKEDFEKGADEVEALLRRTFVKAKRIVGKKTLRTVTEAHRSCVVVNIGGLMEEIKTG
jgi:hypothetical protein